jgi:hypothetical protein
VVAHGGGRRRGAERDHGLSRTWQSRREEAPDEHTTFGGVAVSRAPDLPPDTHVVPIRRGIHTLLVKESSDRSDAQSMEAPDAVDLTPAVARAAAYRMRRREGKRLGGRIREERGDVQAPHVRPGRRTGVHHAPSRASSPSTGGRARVFFSPYPRIGRRKPASASASDYRWRRLRRMPTTGLP